MLEGWSFWLGGLRSSPKLPHWGVTDEVLRLKRFRTQTVAAVCDKNDACCDKTKPLMGTNGSIYVEGCVLRRIVLGYREKKGQGTRGSPTKEALSLTGSLESLKSLNSLEYL